MRIGYGLRGQASDVATEAAWARDLGLDALSTSEVAHDPFLPLALAAARSLTPFTAVLRGYDIGPADTTHALRALRSIFHGFATIEAGGGFQWSTGTDESFEWLIDLVDLGLRARPAEQPPPA